MRRLIGLALALAVLVPATASARALGVEVWTNRGNDAVFQPGEGIEVKVRASDDAYLLVYEIDAEGAIRVLWPWRGSNGFAEGRRTYRLPPSDSDASLVVEGPEGMGYIVAIASEVPFRRLPWYLRPYDPHAEGVGYFEGEGEGEEDEEEGVTAEGRIVGDPFVAMERIRRRVVEDPEDSHGFATSYASYYVGHAVRYPRYLCNDCHRPGRWAWWDGYDPYYTHCSVFDFRVNWAWYWGPSVWFGRVPYFVYVYRSDCPPYYYDYYRRGVWYSSWDGWRRWTSNWGPRTLTRYKSPPPPGYVPPGKWDRSPGRSPASRVPPGFLSAGDRVPRGGGSVPIGRNRGAIDENYGNPGGGRLKPAPGRSPAERPRDEMTPGDEGTRRERPGVPDRGDRPPQVTPRRTPTPAPAVRPRGEDPGRPGYDRRESPRVEPRQAPRKDPPRAEPPRQEPRKESPRAEPSRQERKEPPPPPARESPRTRPDPPGRGSRVKG